MTISATDARNQFGVLLDRSQRESVTIEKNGRPFAVLLSKFEWDALQEELQELRSERETAHLLSTEANREALEASDRDIRERRLVEVNLPDLDAMAEE